MAAGIVFVWLLVSLFWGSIAKVMASNRGLNERSAYWLGFLLWVIGFVVVTSTHPDEPRSPGASIAPDTSLGLAASPKEPQLQSSTFVADELRKLASLRAAGVLSSDEFERQKAKVLG